MTSVELGKLTRTKTNKNWQSRWRSNSIKAGPAEKVPVEPMEDDCMWQSSCLTTRSGHPLLGSKSPVISRRQQSDTVG